MPTIGASRRTGNRQRGYILVILMLFVALLGIASLAMVQEISFQMKRDREEELIHRGVQYSRAVRRYFKKFGRYPTRIEELENTNNIRFLRRRYKDPITGKDFKPLHLNDIRVSFNPGAASLLPPGPDANISADNPGAPGALNPKATAPSGLGPSSIPATPSPDAQNDGSAPPDQAEQQQAAPRSSPGPLRSVTGKSPGREPQVFGGGAIIGVASLSKEKTIREFNKKDHYNQWQFIYDPSTDRGGLLMTPNQPPLQGAAPLSQQQNGIPGAPGQNFGNGNQHFGTNPGLAPQQPAQPNPQPPNTQEPNEQ